MKKFIEFYERVLLLFLLAATALIGTGTFDWTRGVGFSAWSLSRTTFFFWVIWKILIRVRTGTWHADWFNSPIFLLLLSFFLAVAISLIPDYARGIGDFRYFFFGCVHAVMIMDLFTNRRRLDELILILGLVPGLIFVRGILFDPQLLAFEDMRRLGDPLDHPNTAGYVLSMSLPIAVAVLVIARKKLRGIAGLTVAAQFAALVLTYSRGAWLGTAAAFGYMAALDKNWKLIVTAALVAALCFGFVKPLRARLFTLANPQADIAMNDRFEIMRDAASVGLRHPLLGIGYGRGRLKQMLRQDYAGTAKVKQPIWHAHNVYVELFAETGVLGLGLFLALMGRTGYEILRGIALEPSYRRTLAIGIAASWAAALTSGLGDVPFYHHETRMFLFTLVAVGFCLARVRLRGDPEDNLFARLA